MNITGPRVVVCGAGGFIGGHLVRSLLKQGVRVIRTVDIKPVDEWHQRTEGVENLSLDLMEKENCLMSPSGAGHIYQLAANMGGMGFIENNKALCMLNVMVNSNMLMAAQKVHAGYLG
jgi:GDP-D-mannose 3',5'-epimerase